MTNQPDPAFQLLFATNNAHKVEEVKAILGPSWNIHGLAESGIDVELPETGPTLQANAIEKASYIHDDLHRDCFAEDTGLEVDALDGAPGVYTARYAGPGADATANNQKLLHALEGNPVRTARFRAVIALWWQNELHLFEGVIEGRIAFYPAGKDGFGYDPLFIPNGYDQPFAVLPMEVKSGISHRARAVQQMAAFLHASIG
ncbi:MAG: RdgB/HAM1 family non-canonical purine NTP pyrophosphatase [Saprospiraceae bacterium]|nr:RdgB/HAM1 family non-canonical purine NTP pyrophosphatase [Saprospiraceae bacterium]